MVNRLFILLDLVLIVGVGCIGFVFVAWCFVFLGFIFFACAFNLVVVLVVAFVCRVCLLARYTGCCGCSLGCVAVLVSWVWVFGLFVC